MIALRVRVVTRRAPRVGTDARKTNDPTPRHDGGEANIFLRFRRPSFGSAAHTRPPSPDTPEVADPPDGPHPRGVSNLAARSRYFGRGRLIFFFFFCAIRYESPCERRRSDCFLVRTAGGHVCVCRPRIGCCGDAIYI